MRTGAELCPSVRAQPWPAVRLPMEAPVLQSLR